MATALFCVYEDIRVEFILTINLCKEIKYKETINNPKIYFTFIKRIFTKREIQIKNII